MRPDDGLRFLAFAESTPIAEIGQLDVVWGRLPDNVKSDIRTLVNAAVKPQEGCLASARNCSQAVSRFRP
jgi:hypothetical protein